MVSPIRNNLGFELGWALGTKGLDNNLGHSEAPLCVVLGLDNTDGVIGPGLSHLTHMDHGVLLRVILQDVIRIAIVIIATCNHHQMKFCESCFRFHYQKPAHDH